MVMILIYVLQIKIEKQILNDAREQAISQGNKKSLVLSSENKTPALLAGETSPLDCNSFSDVKNCLLYTSDAADE